MAESKAKASGIAAALLVSQNQFPRVIKTRTAQIGNKFSYHYAEFSEILEQLGPVLRANGITYTFPMESDNGMARVCCRLIHAASGETIEACIPMKVDADPREDGKRITYYRRYLFTGVLGVQAEEDDNSGAASAGAAKRRAGSTSAMRASEKPQAGASAKPTAAERLQKAAIHFRVSVFAGDQEKTDELLRRRFGTADIEAIAVEYSAGEIHAWLDAKAIDEANALKAEYDEKEASDVF